MYRHPNTHPAPDWTVPTPAGNDVSAEARPLRLGWVAAASISLPVIAALAVPVADYVAFTALCGLLVFGLAMNVWRAEYADPARARTQLALAEVDHREQPLRPQMAGRVRA